MTKKYDWLIVWAFAIAGLTLAHWTRSKPSCK